MLKIGGDKPMQEVNLMKWRNPAIVHVRTIFTDEEGEHRLGRFHVHLNGGRYGVLYPFIRFDGYASCVRVNEHARKGTINYIDRDAYSRGEINERI